MVAEAEVPRHEHVFDAVVVVVAVARGGDRGRRRGIAAAAPTAAAALRETDPEPVEGLVIF